MSIYNAQQVAVIRAAEEAVDVNHRRGDVLCLCDTVLYLLDRQIRVEICGYGTFLGCGGEITDVVYRCTDCNAPFHRQCAIRHFDEKSPHKLCAVVRAGSEGETNRGDGSENA